MKNNNSVFRSLCIIAFLAMATIGGVARAEIQTTVTYYHNNFSGSPIAATSGTGALLWKTDYLPYGQRYGTTAGANNEVWFAGHVEDDPAGLVYMEARYYDPDLGRFHGIDKLGFMESNPMSFNRYSYANNNPYKYVDPDGNSPLEWGFIAMDVVSLSANVAAGNYSAAVWDSINIALDVAGPPGASEVSHVIQAGRRLDNAVDVAKSLNGNSKLSQKAQHVYEISDNKTGEVVKTGVSGGKIGKNGKSYRAESQVRNWGKDDFNSTITAEIPSGPGARQKALEIEASNARGLRPENLTNPDYHKRP